MSIAYRGVSLVQLLILVALFTGAASADPLSDAKAAGSSGGNLAVQRFGTQSSSNSNISAPLTNSSTQLKTLDGSQQFAAAVQADSSNKFLWMMMQPSGSGDLTQLKLAQDLDANGAFDYTFTVSSPVSGVCANGFISCLPGTWNNCQAYKWAGASDGKLSYSPVGVSMLGGCYCINSSCGNQLAWQNSGIVLKDLAGGAVAAIQTATPVTITSVSSDQVSITYSGQLTRKADSTATNTVASLASSPSVAQQQAYYTSKGQLESDTANARTAQSLDANSMYSLLTGAMGGVNTDSRKCSVVRAGSVQSNTAAAYTGSGTGAICTDHYIYMMIKDLGTGKYELKLLDTGPDGIDEANHHNCDDDPGGDGWHLQHALQIPQETSTFQAKLKKAIYSITNGHGDGCNSGVAVSINGAIQGMNTPVQATVPCPAGGAQTLFFDWNYEFEYVTDEYKEVVSDQCAVLESNSDCRLKDEVIDGVTTVNNFVSTGLRPITTCRSFAGEVKSMLACNSWWKVDRTYICGKREFDFSDVKKRYNTVMQSTTDNTTNLTYTDSRKNADASWSDSMNMITLPEREVVDTCEKACKIKRPKIDANVSASGPVARNRDTNESSDIFYLTCTDNGATCPSEPGDIVVTNCGCLNEFGQAATYMQVMRMMGTDAICTSGVAK